ncbi:unnamed protein product [Ectocarpus sp. CCAP 1310/34]|nr:unnamed protein product [Ectocarpus sp. CCAP 1310/34]
MVTPSGYRKTVRQTLLLTRGLVRCTRRTWWSSDTGTQVLFSEAVKHPEMLLEYGEEGAADGESEAENEARFIDFEMLYAMMEREELLRPRQVHRAPVDHVTRIIDSVDDCDAYHNYRTLKKDMPRLMEAFGFPNLIGLENGCVFRGEEAFLLLLMRMSKGRPLGLTYDDICAFIDGTLRRFCRPDGHDDIQREVYDGHHRDHGLVYQAVQAPSAMIIDAWGPVSGRRHDLYLLRVSELSPRLAAVQDPDGRR